MTYAEKLKDPRWQKKRLETLREHNWSCDRCESTDKTLNVHHTYYAKKKEPWEYETYDLSVLCDDCHKQYHAEEALLDSLVVRIKSDINLRSQLMTVAGFIAATLQDGPFDVPIYSYEYADGVSSYINGVRGETTTAKEIVGILENGELHYGDFYRLCKEGK